MSPDPASLLRSGLNKSSGAASVLRRRRTGMRWSVNRMVLAGCAALLAAGPVRAAGPALPAVESRDFAATAARLAVGSRLRLENVQVANSGETRALVLERFEVFAQDAKITVHGDDGDKVLPPPANAYFRGVIDGRPESRAFLA